jgi:hypothetical protein
MNELRIPFPIILFKKEQPCLADILSTEEHNQDLTLHGGMKRFLAAS